MVFMENKTINKKIEGRVAEQICLAEQPELDEMTKAIPTHGGKTLRGTYIH